MSAIVIEQHLPLVRSLAVHLSKKLPPSIELDDLIQEGSIGLLQAAARYNPARNDNFALYAQSRILGAMRDSIRRRHWANSVLSPLDGEKD